MIIAFQRISELIQKIVRREGPVMYKVFLVEDENVVREGIRKNILWEEYGFQYTGDAPDGELALPMIRKIQPDLLITDIKMPFMDGLSLIRIVKKEFPRTKIVIISGYDDFSYAQQAIHMGVEQYLLKPIIKEKLTEMLVEMREKIQEERQMQEYIESFKREAQEYENFARRRFLEQIVTGSLSVPEIYETANNLNIDIVSPYYNIVLFSLSSSEYDGSVPESYTESLAAVQNSITRYLTDNPDLIFFRWNITTYTVLVKGTESNIKENTHKCMENISNRCAMAGRDIRWHIACGTPVSRLSAIPNCFSEANRILSYRYLCPDEHVLSEESILNLRNSNHSHAGIDKMEIDREHIMKFLSSGTEKEIDNFIDQLLQNAGEEFISYSVFSKYFAMTVYFAAIKYLDSICCNSESLWLPEFRPDEDTSTIEGARKYVYRIIRQAIELRDRESIKQQRDILRRAVDFIDRNFWDVSVSLDRVAKEVNISPNYLSAIFSQEMGQTLTEYLTSKRIEEAKRMLRQTDKLLSEIAYAVGYKDSRYFSFVFKKITGRTPSEYRKGVKQ